jgi:glycosyltransferase involved in cell wall biosynthesis
MYQNISGLRICRVVTVPLTFEVLLAGQLRFFNQVGVDATLVSGIGESTLDFGLPHKYVPLTRTVSPTADLKAIYALTHFLRQEKFDVVHSNTPKAGMVTAVAGWLARIPIRMHTFTGQVWVELSGGIRYVAKSSDQLIGRLNTHCYADSLSQQAFLINENIVSAQKIKTLGDGSLTGVNLAHYNPARFGEPEKEALRQALNIHADDLVILFVGRITRDKGIAELVSAFSEVAQSNNKVHLVLVGLFEAIRESLPADTAEQLQTDRRIHLTGFVEDPAAYMAMSDIFCLPSYREGFPTVTLEAGAMGLPVVATAVTGTN